MFVKFLLFFLKIFNNVYEQHTGILMLCIGLKLVDLNNYARI